VYFITTFTCSAWTIFLVSIPRRGVDEVDVTEVRPTFTLSLRLIHTLAALQACTVVHRQRALSTRWRLRTLERKLLCTVHPLAASIVRVVRLCSGSGSVQARDNKFSTACHTRLAARSHSHNWCFMHVLAARGPNVCATRIHAVFHDAFLCVGSAADTVLSLEAAHCGEPVLVLLPAPSSPPPPSITSIALSLWLCGSLFHFHERA
jgi:hypothetical protein